MKLKKAKLKTENEIVDSLNPLVKEWFFSKFKEFSLTQRYGVIPIWDRENILISAPTGGTKTLTAFLSILNYLVGLAEKNELEDKVYAVYISPLKALSNDIFKNLNEPLEEIYEIADKWNLKLQKIRVSLRTGDTSASEKQKQTRKSPHILITTPESLAIVLNAKKFVENLWAVEFLIVDEIHALANKRGVHLSLSLERLEEMSVITPVRVGLSATIAPLEDIAMFLTGNRDCLIADVELNKKTDVQVLIPVSDLIETSGDEMYSGLYDLVDSLIQEHKTTLIFTNTRAGTERVVHHLKEKFPNKYIDNIGAHHSSISKDTRFNIEERLRKGELKVVVCSTSLELGIDIGYIDLVILLGSPKGSARAMQRIGRAGHKLHETTKGRFIVLDTDDLVECSVIKKEITERKIDKVCIPKNCLDVLSQQIYGMAIYKVWDVKKMFDLIKKSYCYYDLKYEDFLSVISYLSGEYALEHRNVYAKIWYDEKTQQIGKRGKMARVLYMTNIGTIPDESFVSVVIARGGIRGIIIGKIDESFLEKLKRGDVFVLGGQRYEFLYSKGMKAYVNSSVNRAPNIPSWFSEMLPLSFDLGLEISRFRGLVEEKFKNKVDKKGIVGFIQDFCYVNEEIAEKIYDYFEMQFKYIGIPHDKKIIIENYHEKVGDKNKNYFIFHSLFGRRVNDALSRAIGLLIGNIGRRDIEIRINDNGFFILGEKISEEKIKKVLEFLNSEESNKIQKDRFSEALKEAVYKTEVFKRRFRHCATRSLMILKNYKGQKKSVGKQQMKSHFLLSAVQKISSEFPILKEAKREILEDMMDINSARKVLEWIKKGKIKIEFKETEIPSPFAVNLVMQGHYDLIRIEDKIDFLKRIHKEIENRIKSKSQSQQAVRYF
ncbi:MAG: ATP-dependent helicase [Nanoarchaeota archaeon]|nr:ATP-dependent helicase [Nanoarchaeota archaeon]